MTDGREVSGLSLRELLMEVRRDVKLVFEKIDHLDNATVKKSDLELWTETQKNTKRWAITTIISLAVLGIMVLGLLIQMNGLL